ncbi:aldehyde dehydrogenase family protein [Myxococcota bacterium]|nr:aldehyde dehydrogenase family protein [Myxococcota bacterium]
MSEYWHEQRLLIDGELVEATGGRLYDNINPATEQVIGQAADAQPEDIDRAVVAARRAFDETDWSRDHALRARCLRQLHEAITERIEDLREAYIAEVGCPKIMTYGPGIDVPVKSLNYYADFLEKYAWSEDLGEAEVFGNKSHRWIEREAVGVVAAITAWNFPIELNIKKAGWALAAGCTVVLKGAPATPWCTLLLGQLIQEKTDIPPGVINTITSGSNGIGEQLTTDPRIDMVSFTGSTATGKRILEVTAPRVVRVALELGGKSANILLDDVPDFAAAVAGGGMGVCGHAGQGCAILSRLLVPNDRMDEAAEILGATMPNVKYGDPTNPENMMGPLCSAQQREKVEAMIAQGIEEGSRLLCGGKRPEHLPQGYFIEPTAFSHVDPDSTIAQQEFFGPVQCLIGYEDEEDAIRIANNSIYGLSGGVVSADIERARNVARRIRTGTMSVNGGIYYGPEVPFGGYRESGLGRENGTVGFEEFLEVKSFAEPAGS